MSSTPANYQSAMSSTQEHYDILVIGKAGNGKSALCNTLLGQDKFEMGRSMATTTITADSGDRSYNYSTIRVVNSPDITNNGMNEAEKRTEVEKWKHLIPSTIPSLVLIAIRCDVRFTAEEYAIYQEIKKLWGPFADKELEKNLVVAFTFGDRQDNDIETDVKNPPPELGQILRLAKKRYLVFTNKDSADRAAQAQECFGLMEKMASQRSSGAANDRFCGCC